jgi:hypothetical protein
VEKNNGIAPSRARETRKSCETETSLKPLCRTLRVRNPSGRAWQPVVKVARPLLASSGRALRCRDLLVFSCNTAASQRLDPGPNLRRISSRDFNHGLLDLGADCRSVVQVIKAMRGAASALYCTTEPNPRRGIAPSQARERRK